MNYVEKGMQWLEENGYLQHDAMEEDPKYGVPEQKKFPLPDADHVHSAIRFFNYVEPQYEKELAKAILKRAKEYGVDIRLHNIIYKLTEEMESAMKLKQFVLVLN